MKFLIPFFSGFFTLILQAGTLQFAGVLGNSGELDRPVTFAAPGKTTRALGVAYDARRGVLYERAGRGRLNAYALDGRLLAQYKIIEGEDRHDTSTLCGDYLVLLLSRQLYQLKLNAPDGASAEKIDCAITDPEGLSSSSRDGRVAVRSKAGDLYLLDPATGDTTPFGHAPGEPYTGMDWDQTGAFILVFSKVAQKLENGTLVENAQWPKRFAGPRESGIDCATHLGGYWYGSAWHGTIKRFTANFEPAPGVVLGGASGHFIGHVACNYDIELAQGICEISPGLFAIGGIHGIIQLAEWKPADNRLVLLRRIGAQLPPGGVALDSQGRILAGNNIWKWTDSALAPADVSNVFSMISPCVHFDADTILGIATVYGKPSIAIGSFYEEKLDCPRLNQLELPEDIAGVALYREHPGNKGAWRFLVLGLKGDPKLHEVAQDTRSPWRKCLGNIKLQTATPITNYTSLAMQDPETLLAAGDGQLIAFERDGADWKESSRWSDSFGNQLRIAVDGERLAVADTENHRVILYSLPGRSRVAEAEVKQPECIAINGTFMVVYDAAGQRLIKFQIMR